MQAARNENQMSQSSPPSAPQNPASLSHPIRPSDLPQGRVVEIELVPDTSTLAAIAAELGLDGLRKMRLTGKLAPLGKHDWRFTGRMGATVIQPCVITLEPVTTRLEEDIERSWRAALEPETASEAEMPEDPGEEPLGEVIDLGMVALEALALAIPLYPQAEGASLKQVNFTEPGKQAMTDEDTKPFAGLAALKAALGSGSDSDEGGEDEG